MANITKISLLLLPSKRKILHVALSKFVEYNDLNRKFGVLCCLSACAIGVNKAEPEPTYSVRPSLEVSVPTKTADELIAELGVSDRLVLQSITKIDNENVLYCYTNGGWSQAYILKNINTGELQLSSVGLK